MKNVDLKQTMIFLACVVLWLAVTILFIGFRPEHIAIAVAMLALYAISTPTRKLLMALIPFLLFAISYDWMNLLPNYKVNPVDTEGLYNLEKTLFGINTAEWGVLTPNEFFARHTTPVADFLAGAFYLCWVPVPVLFGLWLYFGRRYEAYLHFAIVFLLVNLIGFAMYYVHPAAPPWYVAIHGMEAVPGTMGDVAGLGAFDTMTGWNVFNGLYTRNSNVFAAMPSLHSAYTLVAFIYAVRYRRVAWSIILGIITVGIWATAVYTSHHYILDVMGGICCALAGFLLFEYVLMKWHRFAHFIARYTKFITIDRK